MKTYTKKEFEKKVMNVIEKMNDDELEKVRCGLYTLYDKLKLNTDTLDLYKLNALSAFLLDITCKIASETIVRIRKEEVPY